MADRYEDRSYEDLYELAQERDIDGRSTMDKDELIAALRADREGSSSGKTVLTVPAGHLPPDDVVDIYKRTVDGSKGHEGDLDKAPIAVHDKVRQAGDFVWEGLPAGPVWVVVGSHVQAGTVEERKD